MCCGPLSVVEAGPVHAGVLAAMHAVCFEDAWDAASLQALLLQPGAFGVIVLCAEQPAAFGLCRVVAEEAELLTCGVMPAFRGRRLGYRMMDGILAGLQCRGGTCLLLEVAEGNLPARRLYRGLGMRIVGRRRHYYRRAGANAEDALILRRDS